MKSTLPIFSRKALSLARGLVSQGSTATTVPANGLSVTNVLAALKEDQFYCSGSLLQVELKDPNHPAVWGLPRDPIVMFELGPAFETKDGFRGNVLASYPKERNPLMSGYLLHSDRIQGKAAALEVQYGDGRVYSIGFTVTDGSGNPTAGTCKVQISKGSATPIDNGPAQTVCR